MADNGRFGNTMSSVKSYFTPNTFITLFLIIVVVIVITYLFVRLGYSIMNYQNDAPYIIEDNIRNNCNELPWFKIIKIL